MTRPKVPPEQRQRTAQACESCKRRKQKCNGLCPCNTCDKRKFTCIYSDRDPASPNDERPPAKKRVVANGDIASPYNNENSALNTPNDGGPQPSSLSPHETRTLSTSLPSGPTLQAPRSHPPSAEVQRSVPKSPDLPVSHDYRDNTGTEILPTHGIGELQRIPSRGTTVHSGDEEAVIYSQSRMLQDPTGRVLYIGDSATLSFLQLIRMMVETVAGSSPFTADPRRHKIVEGQYSLPPGYRHTHLLPDVQTARTLVEAFFINTHGLLQVFEHDRFMQDLERCYADPLATEPSWLCLLNLVFAIGLTMATPLSGSIEAQIVDKLRSEHLDRAEVFYLNSKNLNDPINGLEDQDFWSVQALLLMSVYMLAKSKRNTAFALLGMAARSAHALGLHREETMVIFSTEEQLSRRNLWRSIFVIDRLLSCSLGRPTAISEDDCSGDDLRPIGTNPADQSCQDNAANVPSASETGSCALEAAVRSCSVIGTVLRKVYQQRKISTRLAQEIADVCKAWPRALPSILHWRQAANASPSQGVAILHVNLFYCHSIILLTRPFFLYILNLETQRQVNQMQPASRTPRPYLRMEKFSEACVIASTHTILLVQNAFDAGYLSRRNPAVIYFLFAATLVVLSNEFAGLYRVDAADTCILNALNIMNYCAESDQQANRLVYIISSFRDVVAQQRTQRTAIPPDNTSLPSISSQLYGIPRPSQQQQQQLHQQQQHQGQSTNGPSMSRNGSIETPRLYQLPVHIYPGLAAPPNSSSSSLQPPLPSHHPQYPPTDFSVHLSPINGQISPSRTPGLQAANGQSLSTMLDLSALDATRVPSLHSEESGQDEQIDFDALWAWSGHSGATASPRPGGRTASGGETVAGTTERPQAIGVASAPMVGIEHVRGVYGQEV